MQLRSTTLALIAASLLCGPTACTPPAVRLVPGTPVELASLRGRVEYPDSAPGRNKLSAAPKLSPAGFGLAADLGAVPALATVALLYPADHATAPGALLAAGTSDAAGNFDLRLPQRPEAGALYVLEATRRFGAVGSEGLSLRTLVRWSGTAWSSISRPELVINAKTTALLLAAELDPELAAADVLGTVSVTAGGSEIPAPVAQHSVETLSGLAAQVTALIGLDRDPVAAIAYREGEFVVKKPVNPQLAWLSSHTDCPACELSGEQLDGADLQAKDLRGQDLSRASLLAANLSQAQLNQAVCDGADFGGANLGSADLSQASLRQARLQGADLSGADLSAADLTQADLSAADLRGALLAAGDWSGAILRGARLSNLDLRSLGLTGTLFERAVMDGVNLHAKNLSDLDLRDADLRSADLGEVDLSRTLLDNARLEGADLQDAVLDQTRLTGAQLDGATWLNGRNCEPGSRSICRYEWLVNQVTASNQDLYSVAGAPDGSSVIVWNNRSSSPYLYARRYDPWGRPRDSSPIRIAQSREDFASDPDVGMAADGSFVVAWGHTDDGAGSGIIARAFNADGTARGNEFIANAHTTGFQSTPAIGVAANGSFVIAWSDLSGRDGNAHGVYHRRFNADASPRALTDQLVNDGATSGRQNQPDVAANNESYAIVYTDESGRDGNDHGVYGRLYSQDGSYYGLQQLHLNTNGRQNMPAVAMAGDSDFVVSWTSAGHDGSGTGVHWRRFFYQPGNVNGFGVQPDSSEEVANTYTSLNQGTPAIAMNAGGDFVIAWDSASQDGTPTGVYAQRYDGRYAEPVGSEFKLDTTTSGNQYAPALALSANRRVTAVWASENLDGSGVGVAAKQLEF